MVENTGQRYGFVVNGRPVEVRAPETTPLLEALRNDLGLRGARFGCGAGSCGACTVVIDGEARKSCQMLVSEAAGRAVETIESLLGADPPHPLLTEVAAANAGQCGYCLSGVLMRAKALLDGAGTPPGRAAISEALSDHLCRCGAHGRILTAIERAAARSCGA